MTKFFELVEISEAVANLLDAFRSTFQALEGSISRKKKLTSFDPRFDLQIILTLMASQSEAEYDSSVS